MTRPDYIQKKVDELSGEGRIAKEGYEERELKKTDQGRKFREHLQKDEQKAMDKHGEAVCYGCLKKDFALSTLLYCCSDCMRKRGTVALYAIVTRKPAEQVCDFCGRWQKPFDTFQINCSMCNTCMHRVHVFHSEYKKAGGRKSNPFVRRMRKKYGKDYKKILGNGSRTIGI
ncbi:MAG: hypothetical protein GWN01_01265 [Nitrosopumilaceae archaeon]|nr:hypothetical protein [Nitrosopumilaceae archaeon]NIU85989.1 hypothetical protein [Nitrosopumilaceae archaeon]NIX60208.1 hypothetical protein [Nitrosopumilaceae archaeon]